MSDIENLKDKLRLMDGNSSKVAVDIGFLREAHKKLGGLKMMAILQEIEDEPYIPGKTGSSK